MVDPGVKTNSIFETDWWLDAVAEGSWERISVVNKNNEVIASFPIVKRRRFGQKILSEPTLTQTLGIYIEDTGAKLCKKKEKQKKLINQIIERLPKGYQYDFYLDSNNDYVLPFIWSGFRVEPYFSYRIDDLSDMEEVWKGFKENIKTDIRKAKKIVTVEETDDIEVMIDMQVKTFERQGRKSPSNKEIIRCFDKAAKEHNSRLILQAKDEEGNIHAATYFLYDDERCYYLLGGGDPQYRNSGANSLLIWEGIQFASTKSKIFDFEGSMIEDIERFVRGFGSKEHVYYRVKKLNWMLTFADYIKPKVKRLLEYK